MSTFGSVAAGLLGGFGGGLAKQGAREADAEIEEAKELRARAFQKEMYATQRGHTVEDATLKREQTLEDLDRHEGFVLGTTVMANNEAAERDTIAHKRAIEKAGLLDDLGRQAEDRQARREEGYIAREVTGLDDKGVPTVFMFSKKGELIKDVPANAKNLLKDADAKGLSPDKQLEFWQKAQMVQEDLANQRTSLREKMGLGSEENDAQLQIQLNALDAQSEALDKQVRILAPYIGATLGNAERIEQWGTKSATMFPNLPQQEAIDEYLKGARKVLASDQIEKFVADYIADDPTAIALMTIWRNEQPGQAIKIEGIVQEKQGESVHAELLAEREAGRQTPVASPEVAPAAQPQQEVIQPQPTVSPVPKTSPPTSTRSKAWNPLSMFKGEGLLDSKEDVLRVYNMILQRAENAPNEQERLRLTAEAERYYNQFLK